MTRATRWKASGSPGWAPPREQQRLPMHRHRHRLQSLHHQSNLRLRRPPRPPGIRSSRQKVPCLLLPAIRRQLLILRRIPAVPVPEAPSPAVLPEATASGTGNTGGTSGGTAAGTQQGTSQGTTQGGANPPKTGDISHFWIWVGIGAVLTLIVIAAGKRVFAD